MSASRLILPGSANGLLLGGLKPLDSLWKCPMCDVTYGKGQDRAIARHFDDAHSDDLAEWAEQRAKEPLRITDEEMVTHYKRAAIKRGDKTVKGHL